MPLHMVSWFENVAAVTDNTITPVQDNLVPIANGRFLPADPWSFLAFALLGTGVDRYRLIQPSNRVVTNPILVPHNDGATFPTDANIADYRRFPFPARAREPFTIDVTTPGVGPQDVHAFAVLSNGITQPRQGKVYTLRGTSATVPTADVWSQITVTWADNLAAGLYQCIGGKVVGSTTLAARILFQNQVERPGILGVANVDNRVPSMFRMGGLGVLGTFQGDVMPQIEVFATTAAAITEILLDIVPLS